MELDNIIERHTSPDRVLILVVTGEADGEKSIGFEGGTWHTQPDLLDEYSTSESTAKDEYVSDIISDKLPIVCIVENSAAPSYFVSGFLSETIKFSKGKQIEFRVWSGATLTESEAIQLDKDCKQKYL